MLNGTFGVVAMLNSDLPWSACADQPCVGSI